MRYKKLIIAVVGMMLIISLSSCFGQVSNIHTVTGQPIMLQKKYDGVQGSPYFIPDWRTGTVIYNHQHIENVQVKYDAFLDQVEIIYNNAPFLPDKKLVQGFEFVNVESGVLINYQFRKGFEGDGVNKENYLSLIYESNNLVLAERIKIDQISVTPATYGEKEYKEFVLTKNHVLINQGGAQRFKPSKRSFIKEFPTIEPKLKSYFKENNVDFNNPRDLTNMAIFIDKMLTTN